MPVVMAGDGSERYSELHGDGPTTLVFAHGAGGNHMSWWQQVPHFRDRFRCLTFDHRGFGRRTDATGQLNRAYRADLELLLTMPGGGGSAGGAVHGGLQLPHLRRRPPGAGEGAADGGQLPGRRRRGAARQRAGL